MIRPGAEKQWYAVKTRFKSEKHVRQSLEKKGIDCYVPMLKKTKRYVRKIKEYAVPLIHCFVFVHIDQSDYVRTLQTEHVLDFLRFGNQLIPVPEAEIDTLKCFCGEIGNVRVEDLDLVEGEAVEIRSGQLTGVRGTLVRAFNKHEFVVQLQSIGYQLRVVVDKSMLERVPAA